uniref:HECT-type E3 ubiquitin transferase n=1 Tax=Cajanus cajan TaxID=3821 RepID=A0A151TZ12_CAJCA|nr:E3 ubiquitin-protein ligase UPL1 [Cajanus cajan]
MSFLVIDWFQPPKIKAFIAKIIQCPLQDIAIPLSGFRWEYNKGNFHHWRPLLLHFDTYFKTYLSCRKDLTLLDNLEDDSPLPKHAILQILRVMQIILENCPNKSSFDGLEHFKLLLASTDPEILIATLETLSALVKINPSKLHGSTKMICCGSVNSYLLSLAQGWGSKEEGLGLYSCVMANEKAQDEALIPSELRYSLLTRIRYARAFRSPRICRLYSRICLLSFIVLVQSGDAQDELAAFFANEPEYTNELIRIVRSEEIISGSIRTLAMLALGAQLAAYTSSHHRARILSGSSLTFAGSGMVPTFLPLLEDFDSTHIHLVCFAVKTLQKLMDYSSSAVSLFKELGGIELLAQRLQKEVHRVIGLVGETDNMMLTGESTKHSTDQLYSQKRLIKVSLKALGSATYAPANSTRSQHSQDTSLPTTLSLIFQNVDKFGGDIYYSAVTVMSEIIHKDPTCFSALHEMGLPDAFLLSVGSEILPSSKALTCIPNGLGAICLNAKGLEAVRESSSLRFLVDIFTSKKYVLAMNEAIVPLANAVEELLRHVSSLRSTGVDIIIEIIHKIASFGDGNIAGPSVKAEGTAMETDSEDKENEGNCCIVGTSYSDVEGISDEQFIQLCVFHLMVLVHRTMENAEACRLFVEKSGIEALLIYGGRENLSGTEESISTKCRYFGKVIDFIDSILMERPDSCNPILLNCLYGRGVIETVLTTFDATSQLLFTVNRAPASPMDTDDANPLTNGDTPFPRDAETFVKVLQSRVLKTVLPVWTHLQFVDCSHEFISTVISIIRHVYTGVEVKNVNGSSGARITGPPPNETTISTIVEMGFSRSRAEEALRQVGSNSVELAMEWLFSHPEETQEDDELARALAMSLGNSESDAKDAVANDNSLQLEEEMVQLPPIDELSNVVSFIVERIKECEILLMYSSSVHVLLRRDAEISSIRGSYQKSPAGLSMGGIFYHILHNFLPHSRNSKKDKKVDGDWRQKLATRANQFMVAACVRSTEARKRVFSEISYIISEFVDSCQDITRPGNEIQVFVDLLNDVLAARTPAGSCISAEASTTFIDVGLVKSFTRTLQVLDLDHADSSEVATAIVKALELVTKEHVHSVDSSTGKGDNSAKPVLSQPGRSNNIGDMSQSIEMTSQVNHDSLQVDHVGSYAVRSYGGSEAVTDDMEHDQDLDGGFAPANVDDYMHENSEDARDLENGMENVDQDDHEIDDEDFDDEVMEDEDDEEDEDGVILRLEEGINGINVFDHIEVFGRENSFPNEAFHVMPVEVFGSRRPSRTTSIYSLLGRTGDPAVPSRHPLLVEPSASFSEFLLLIIYSIDNSSLENNSVGLDNIFRSLRSGRHGHRLHLWTDNNQQSGGPNTVVVPQGLEELLVTQLRRPTPEKSSNQNIAEMGSDGNVGTTQAQDAEGGAGPEVPVESNAILEVMTVTPSVIDNSNNADVRPAGTGPPQTIVSSTHSQAVEMQFEHNDGAVRDVEAVSQESSGSGATFGESLRSLDVEIGSADGHDDGGERQVSADRIAAENSSRDADQDVPAAEQQVNSDAGSGAIDPAFLDALPEELRAEVLSAQQGQAAQPSNVESQNTGDIDPEFLAALPVDIRAEVLAQQQAQRLHQSQELEGQPVEMDTVSIIATFPSDLREEASFSSFQVLLTSPDTILANLTPALVAEANMLRERFAHRYSRTLFGMYPRSRRGEPSRRDGIGTGLDGAVGTIASRRSSGAKVVEADGAPLVDTEALHAMIRLFRVVQPLYKGQLQRLLLNLCAHSETRTFLVKILMDLLMLDVKRPISYFSKVEPPYRLYGCQSNVMYSRPQSFDGVPPLLSRRILETLTYLARNHLYVAKILLQFRLPLPAIKEPDDARGKSVMVVEDEVSISESNEGYISIAMLLGLLNQPLYLRSIAHLEQLLNLLDVIIDSAGNKSSNKSLISTNPSGPQISIVEADVNANSNILPSGNDVSTKADDSSKPTSSGINVECESHGVLSDLPKAELRLMCSLLAQEGLSDNAYTLVAEVMKKLVAIAPTHCELFVTELAEAVQKLTSSAMDELRVFSEAMKALLSTSSSDGAAILRVLQALSSLVTLLTEKDNDRDTPAALSEVWEINSALEPLWHELSCCISKIESYSESTSELLTSSRTFVSKPSGVMPPLPAGSQNILPYIESFFVVCEKLHPAQPGASHDSSIPVISDVEYASTSATPQKASGTSVKVDEKHVAFVRFSEKHRKLLNAFIRQNPGLLEKSFSLMLKVPRFIDFDNKRAHFRSKIKHQHDHHHSPLRISVRRAYVLEDSYNQLRMRSTQDLKGRLTVHFQGEEGIDAGGLTREWYQLLSRVIFDKGALLFTTVGNESTFQPNPNSVYQTEHLSYFKFVGRVVGKALFDGQLLDVHFTRSFYKHILGVKVTYHDIEAIDPDYFKNLKWMLEASAFIDVLDLTFSIDADEEKLILYERTEVTDYELIPGGRNIKVTEENKHQYVDLVAEHRLTTAIRPQINSFLEGFNELIPRELISIFNDKELELLISGLPDIDLDDLRANTEYSGYSAASPVIQWFWEVVQGFSKEDKARLLQFVTGTSKVPLEGFSALQGISGSQKFQIHKAYGSPDHLPSAHTCFNQLDLPEYPSKQHLEERLLLAIHEGSEGFGFG